MTLLAAGSSACFGQTPLAVPANPDSALQTIVGSLDGTPLSLHDAVQSALHNSTSVLTAEAALMAAGGARRREAGAFDPTLFFSFDRMNQELPSVSLFTGNTNQNTMTGGVRWNLPIGTNIEASLNTVRLETNSTFAFLNPQFTAYGTVNLRQPLLGGLFVSAQKNLTKADRELEAARARYDQEVLAVGTQVEVSYWDLYAAERDYAVQKLTRDRAEAFLRDTETRAKTGLIGPNQVANARTFLAEQEILLLDREEGLDRISDELSSLIGKRPDAGKTRLLSVDNPPDDFPIEDADLLVERSMEKNLALQAAKADVEARRALSRAAFWEALPSVDVVGSIGGN